MSDVEAVEKMMRDYVYEKVENIPDFPKPGVDYKDITPILEDPHALQYTTYLLARPFHNQVIDKVVGIESRGFLLGPSLAYTFNAGFATVRKKGKLPREAISTTYHLEYDSSTVEMHTDAIRPHERVLIHDDLLATGGSVAAASDLINQLGGQICGYSFIIELNALEGRQQLDQSVPIRSILAM